MRKIFLFFMAAFILTSCDNLKKKPKPKDDTEETTSKPDAEDDDNSSDDSEDATTTGGSDDDDNGTASTGWTSSSKRDFLAACTGEAEKNVSSERAKEYCNCALKQAQKIFEDPNDLRSMTKEQEREIASHCNN